MVSEKNGDILPIFILFLFHLQKKNLKNPLLPLFYVVSVCVDLPGLEGQDAWVLGTTCSLAIGVKSPCN